MGKYAVGIDFGTLSCRAVVLDLETGAEAGSAEYVYPHGVMERRLPCGTVLGKDFALQDPRDYVEGLSESVKSAVSASGASASDIIGMGVDFTSSTVLALKKDGAPLCFDEKYKSRPHAYAKLWKHHGAAREADMFLKTAKERGERFLGYYGGGISPEWMLPKMLETFINDRDAYDETDVFAEGGDYITRLLTGEKNAGKAGVGFKSFYNDEDGYPSKEYFSAVYPGFGDTVLEKLPRVIKLPGEAAGYMNKEGSNLTGLREGTPVASFVLDAHAALPASGAAGPGKMLLIMGTSTVQVISCEENKLIPGISGIVKDGIVPGLYSIETGQSSTGDLYDWFTKNCVSGEYVSEAESRGISLHSLLTEKCSRLSPGASGILALDWWNGNRSVLQRAEMSGLMIGMTLTTAPEEMYRAALEATAFGSRIIFENLENGGVPASEIIASGGIPLKNPFLVQMYSDVFKRPISVSPVKQPGAFGSALYGAVAGGYFTSITEASDKLGARPVKTYYPNVENSKIYDLLFDEYVKLHDYFGRGGSEVMRRLREISADCAKGEK